MTISDVLPQFKRWALYERAMTVGHFKDMVRTLEWLQEFTGLEEISDFDEGIIREFLHEKKAERDWANKTFRLYLQHMKSFFDWCIRNKLLKKNPTIGIEKPKLPQRIPRCLNKEQVLIILSQVRWFNWYYKVEGSRNEAILNCFLFTGLRLSELIKLKIIDVNSSTKEIMVREGKGKKDRIVPLHPRLSMVLKGYLEERKKYCKPSIWLFTSVRSDKKLSPKNIQTMCRKVSAISGIKFTPHMLRHTFARLSLDAGSDFYDLKEILGHSDIATTQIYASVSIKKVKERFERLRLL